MAGNAAKRFRASNYSVEETNILIDLVEEHKNVLENKHTDALTWRQKDEEWETVARKFNSRTLSKRAMKELRAKYVGLKKLARKKAAKETQSLRATGGGPPLKTTFDDDDVILERVHGLIALSADGLQSRFGSDRMEAMRPDQREGSADEDEPEEVSFIDDFGDGVMVATGEMDEEWKETEITPSANFRKWGNYSVPMLRTPKSAALVWKPVVDTESAPGYEQRLSTEPAPNSESVATPAVSPGGKLRSRRRPVMRPKKTPALSSTTNKFVTLAEVKTELARVQLAATVARNANSERRDEELHALNVQILQQELRRKIVVAEQEELKLKRMQDGDE